MNVTAKRILAILIDVFVFGFIAVISFLAVCYLIVRYQLDERFFLSSWYTVICILFIMRDAINIGIGKKVMKLNVKCIDADYRSTKETDTGNAGWRKIFLRNITLLIWPVELLILLANSSRLGDIIAHTYVE